METQLSQVRHRCVRLLGALGGAVNNVLVQTSHDALAKHLVAWDMDQHLKFDVPFMDIKPTIYLGTSAVVVPAAETVQSGIRSTCKSVAPY